MHERVLSDENAGWGLVRQTSAALVAASLEDLSAVRGSHSLTEAVNLASLSLFRLISHFHNNQSPFVFLNFKIFAADLNYNSAHKLI